MSKIYFFLFVVVGMSGCATMFSSSDDELSFESQPSGASVYRGTELLGTTPFKKSFRRDTFDKTEFVAKKEGYESKSALLEKKFNATSLLNIFFIFTTMGVTSWGIDAASGKLIEYSPRSYLFELKKTGDKTAGNFSERALFLAHNLDRFKFEVAQGGGETVEAYAQLSGLNVAQIQSRSAEVFMEDNPVAIARILQ